KAQQIFAGLVKERFGIVPVIPSYLEEMTLKGDAVQATVQHEPEAHPRIDWNFLTSEVERKWEMFKQRLGDGKDRPWVDQTNLEEALAKMDYYLTRLISKL
ncbi:MAG: MBL fold metallo-hydrolase, partial [Desulfovibrio sp.]|nr:MBL fold metallo-hydrolase [Desulfovibrio sp.]